MKFTCNSKTLTEVLNKAAKATAAKSPMPALMGLLLRLSGNRLHITGYDMEIGIDTAITVQGEEDGAVITNTAKLFSGMVAKMKSSVTISTNENIISIESGKSKMDFIGLSANDFPSLPEFDDDNVKLIPSDTLQAAISHTLYAADAASVNASARGVLINQEDGMFTAVATNGTILAQHSETANTGNFRVLVPIEAMKIVDGILSEDDFVKINPTKSLISFTCGNTTVIARTMDDMFLNYKQIFSNAEAGCEAVFNKSELKEVLERVKLVNDGQAKLNNPVHLFFGGSKVDINLQANCGKLTETLDVKYNGKAMSIKVSANKLYSAISAVSCDRVSLALSGELKPIIITADNDKCYKALVLPIRQK